MPKKFAFIPARGGSQRIPNKNIIDVCGSPLISYAIRAALDSELFDSVYVNSDSDRILAVSQEHGAVPYKRPAPMGAQEVYIINILQEMANDLSWEDDDVVAVMLPTCPLCQSHDVAEAHSLFLEHGLRHGVVSVATYEVPIQLAHYVNESGVLEPFFKSDYAKSTKSTDHRTGYRYNEGVVFNTVGAFRSQHNLVGKNSIPYVMDGIRSISIDYPYQLEVVRAVMAHCCSPGFEAVKNSPAEEKG